MFYYKLFLSPLSLMNTAEEETSTEQALRAGTFLLRPRAAVQTLATSLCIFQDFRTIGEVW